MRFVAFLRGMNLGRRRIRNDELIEHLGAIGFPGASAFLASGNVVFDADGSAAHVAAAIANGLAERLDYAVPTFVRTADQVRAIAESDPFAGIRHGEGKLQVAMLGRAPKANVRSEVLAIASDDDLLALRGSELYWWPRCGVARSQLDVAGIERALGPMTVRTIGTIRRLAKTFLAGS